MYSSCLYIARVDKQVHVEAMRVSFYKIRLLSSLHCRSARCPPIYRQPSGRGLGISHRSSISQVKHSCNGCNVLIRWSIHPHPPSPVRSLHQCLLISDLIDIFAWINFNFQDCSWVGTFTLAAHLTEPRLWLIQQNQDHWSLNHKFSTRVQWYFTILDTLLARATAYDPFVLTERWKHSRAGSSNSTETLTSLARSR